MKKGLKFTLLLMLSITFILPYSCKNKVNESDASGTIGKVKKYRKDQMSEGDIKLRSEFTEDPEKLAG